MTVVRVSCPSCGDLKLQSSDITLRTCIGREGGEYRWKCKCGIVVRQAVQKIIDILRSVGIKEELWELPLELMERPVDGVLTEDAIIDLELAFQDGSIYDRITKK